MVCNVSFEIYPSIFCCLSGVRSGWSQVKRRYPDLALCSGALQSLLWDSKAFPGQMRYIVAPMCFGSIPVSAGRAQKTRSRGWPGGRCTNRRLALKDAKRFHSFGHCTKLLTTGGSSSSAWQRTTASDLDVVTLNSAASHFSPHSPSAYRRSAEPHHLQKPRVLN